MHPIRVDENEKPWQSMRADMLMRYREKLDSKTLSCGGTMYVLYMYQYSSCIFPSIHITEFLHAQQLYTQKPTWYEKALAQDARVRD